VTKKVGRRIAGILLVGAAAWFLVNAITSNWQALREHEWRVNPGLLATSIAVHIAVLAWGVAIWSRVIRFFSAPAVGTRLLLSVWFLSNLAKYIPGKIFQFVAVADLGQRVGAPPRLLLVSLLVHTALALLAGTLLSSWTLSEQLIPAVPPAAVGITVTAAAVLMVHPSILNWALGLVSRVARGQLLRWNGRWRDGIVLLLLSVASWMLYGLAYYLFLLSLTPLPLSALPVLSGVNALSFVAGYLAIVTPGGLGVREAAMTALLLPLVPQSVAAVLAISSRLWTIITELLAGALVLLLGRPKIPGGADHVGHDPEVMERVE
jgi:glycosyltransferase 2 family protein